jgi:hypothetical protein
MILGIDFDNTIICYDQLFHLLASEEGLLPDGIPEDKTAVRDFLRKAGKEEAWTRLQGIAYGTGISGAKAFPGVKGFFETAKDKGHQTVIISHKTKHPYRGEKHDLHTAALSWLVSHGFVGSENELGKALFFEPTKEEKVARIRDFGCDAFIDDLPEFLGLPGYLEKTKRCLFDPAGNYPEYDGGPKFRSWDEITGGLIH